MTRLEEGRVVASIFPVPLQLRPPVLLAVHSWAAVWAVGGGREALEAPASPHPDGLELGCKHPGGAYLMQLGELVQVYVLQLWELQFTFLIAGDEYLTDITTIDDVDGLQAGQGTVVPP